MRRFGEKPFHFTILPIHSPNLCVIINQINFVSIFKCKGKCVKLHFYQLKKIQFQSHPSHHSQTFINFPYTFHFIHLNPNILTFFTLSLQIILNSLSHFHSLIQTKPKSYYYVLLILNIFLFALI